MYKEVILGWVEMIRDYGVRIFPIILIITKILCNKYKKELKDELDYFSDLGKFEIWDAIWEEAKKGNRTALTAIIVYWINTFSSFCFFGLILLYI